jgi:NAD(P)-dependent dehydrogenase (short-subunit alcohol dehydrogenase family)
MTKELLIFGANGALGKEIVEYFSAKNFDKKHLFDFNFDDANGDGSEKIIIKDLAKEGNVEEAFKSVKAGKNKLFFLYSTIGGFAGGKHIWDAEISEFDKMISMNLKSNYLISKYFSKLVKDSAGGSICLTAAMSGIITEEKKASYGISKAALIHLVKELAHEGKKINLSANAIAPYIIDTPANREWMKGSEHSDWSKPSEIARMAEFLFDNFKSVSGSIITLRGGFEVK